VNLKASKCHCGKESVPPTTRCPLCGKQMDPENVSNKGTVLSFTVLHVPPEGFQAPLKVAIVELESGAHVFCNYQKELNLGSPVEVVPDGPRFKIKT